MMTTRIDAYKLAVVALAAAALGLVAAWMVHRSHIAVAREHHRDQTLALAQDLNSHVIDRLQGAAQSIALDKRVVASAAGQLGIDDPSTLIVLETTWTNFNADIVYVMNTSGDVVASSAFNGRSLTGNNYAFRPYFVQALKAKSVLYPALGVTTAERGIYTSAPVLPDGGKPAGVLVIKSGLEAVDRLLAASADRLALVSPQGVVFAANQSQWLFRMSRPCPPQELAEIRKSRQFADQPLEPLPDGLFLDAPTVTIGSRPSGVVRVPVGIVDSEDRSWEVLSIRDYRTAHPVGQIVITALAMAALVMVSGLYLTGRLARAALAKEAAASRESLDAARISLEKSHQLLTSLLDAVPDLLIVIDREYRIVYSNAKGHDLIEQPDPAKRTTCYGRFKLLAQPCEDCSALPVFQTGKAVEREMVNPADGRIREVRAFPIANATGGVEMVVEYVRDITERKLGHQDLEQSRRLLAQVIDFLPDATFVIDREGRVVAWNKAIEKMTGVSAEDMLGKGDYAYSLAFYDKRRPILIDLVTQPDRLIEEKYAYVRRQDDILFAEATPDNLRFDNAHLLGLARPIYDAEGTAVGAIECVRDISEYKNAEAKIRRNEARLRSLVGLLQEPLSTTHAFLDRVLEEAILLTESQIGYIYHYSEDSRQFVLNSWSKQVMSDCAVVKPQTCYELDKTGIWGEAVRQGRPVILNDFQADHPLKKGYPQGHVALCRFLTVPVFSAGRIVAVVGVANKQNDYGETDVLQLTLLMETVWKVVDRRLAEKSLSNEQERFRVLVDSVPFGVALIGPDGTYKYLNPPFVGMFGYGLDDIPTGLQWMRLAFPDPSYRHKVISTWIDDRNRLSTGHSRVRIFTVTCKDGTQKVIQFRPVHLQTLDELVICEDITEKRQLEAQFLQAQKMESVGRLAGGVAHDFNNMLQAILGQTELALMTMDKDHPLHHHFQQIRQSAWRSADLVRQLLAFARKQAASPKVLDLNDTVAGMLKMLRRLIGEDIDLAWMPGHALWNVIIDPSQVDQILANLTVNARDAIAGVGKVTIETQNITLDETYCIDHAGFVPGHYVLLAVSDDGCGMDARTMEQIFEPFFTTKAIGEGTGLGLATVYGIVKQNKGFVNVYSEPGQGTTFKIYLPRCQVQTASAGVEDKKGKLPAGTETVLVVEDDVTILAMGQSMLEKLGYTVLTASTPSQALKLAAEHAGAIDLLLTDVVMPEMNGKDMVEKLALIRPQLKHMFMSGYTANVIAHHGVLDPGVSFIQKPFSIRALALKVREVLTKG